MKQSTKTKSIKTSNRYSAKKEEKEDEVTPKLHWKRLEREMSMLGYWKRECCVAYEEEEMKGFCDYIVIQSKRVFAKARVLRFGPHSLLGSAHIQTGLYFEGSTCLFERTETNILESLFLILLPIGS